MLQKEWNRCVRYSSSVSLLVIDINDLRLINDTYGNAFGDECLRSVATILGKFGLRSNDLFARFGGQEFVLMLPGCNSKGSSQIAQSMIDRVKKLDIYNPQESRQNFAANVSHELKTPITLIKGFIETLLGGAGDKKKERDEFLSIVGEHALRLEAIVEDLLSLSRIE